jgi:hypothetical protein
MLDFLDFESGFGLRRPETILGRDELGEDDYLPDVFGGNVKLSNLNEIARYNTQRLKEHTIVNYNCKNACYDRRINAQELRRESYSYSLYGTMILYPIEKYLRCVRLQIVASIWDPTIPAGKTFDSRKAALRTLHFAV